MYGLGVVLYKPPGSNIERQVSLALHASVDGGDDVTLVRSFRKPRVYAIKTSRRSTIVVDLVTSGLKGPRPATIFCVVLVWMNEVVTLMFERRTTPVATIMKI